MSQVIDQLNRISKAAPQPMGFKTAQPVPPKPRMQLIASLAQAESISSLMKHVVGADAILLRISKPGGGIKTIQKIVSTIPDVPWGGWVGDADEKGMAAIIEAGCDFFVFPATISVSATSQNDKVGKILQIDSSLREGLLRAVNELPVDAVLTACEPKAGALTWNHLILCQQLANLLAKPLLVEVTSDVTATDLKNLWEVGIDGILVEVSAEKPVDRLKELSQLIADLPAFPSRKRGKVQAFLPSIRIEAETEAEEEEEEE